MAAVTGRADGSVIIDTKVNTGGFSKGANNLKQQFSGMGADGGTDQRVCCVRSAYGCRSQG